MNSVFAQILEMESPAFIRCRRCRLKTEDMGDGLCTFCRREKHNRRPAMPRVDPCAFAHLGLIQRDPAISSRALEALSQSRQEAIRCAFPAKEGAK